MREFEVPFSIGNDHWIANGFKDEQTQIVRWHVMLESQYVDNNLNDIDADNAQIIADVTDENDIIILKSPQEEMGKMVIRIMLMEIMRKAVPELQELHQYIVKLLQDAQANDSGPIIAEA